MDTALGAAGILEYHDDKLEIMRANEAFYEMFNMKRDEALHYAFQEIFYERNLDPYLKAIRKTIENMDSSECTTQNVRLGDPKNPFWVRTKFRYLNGYDGNYIFYIAVENVDENRNTKLMNIAMFRVMEEMEKNGAFGSILLQMGEPIRIRYFNLTTAAILGYSMEEYRILVDQDAFGCVLPEDRELLLNAIQDAFRQETGMMSCTVRHICKGGRVKAIPVIGIVGANTLGTKYLRLMLIDKPDMEGLAAQTLVAEVKAQENELKDMKAVTEVIGGAYLCCSMKEDMILEVSRGMRKLLGYPKKDKAFLRYNSIEEIVDSSDWPYVYGKLKDAEHHNLQQQELEFRVKTAGGESKWVHADYHAVSKTNNHEYIYLVFTEIDDIHKLKKRLQQQEHLDRLIADNPTVGVVYYEIIGKRWRLDYMSEGNLLMFGYTREQLKELVSNDLLSLIHPEDREKLRAYAFDCAKKLRNYLVRYRMLNAEGEYLEVLTYASFSKHKDELYLCQTNIARPMRKGESSQGFMAYEGEQRYE